MSKKYEMDMCNGPILGKMISFTVPVFLTAILQLLYNAADVVIVGNYASGTALGAVGATGSLVNLLLNVFVGLGVGVNVVTGQCIGLGRKEKVSEIIGCSVVIGLVSGIFLTAIGYFFSETFLSLMNVPDDILPLATKYMEIYFVGAPASIIYNFCTAVLRAYGDTKRPLIFLVISGLVNVVLNLFFVIVTGMDVDGVAWATVISQYLSAVLVLIVLIRSKDYCRLDPKKLRFYKDSAAKIIRIGLPAGIYGSMFSISNVIIQSAVNSFGSSVIVSGISASSSIEGFVYTGMNSVSVATTSFVSQNTGSGKFDRVKQVFFQSIALVTVIYAVMAAVSLVFRYPIFSIYLPNDPDAVAFGINRLIIICSTYFLCGYMDVATGCIRGMGYSTVTTIISVVGTCILRLVWIFTVFNPVKASLDINEALRLLYVVYPISWTVTLTGLLICFVIVLKRVRKKVSEQSLTD